MGDALAQIVQNITTIIAGLVISFTANWILAFIILAVLPLVGLQGFVQVKFLEGFSADAKVSPLTSYSRKPAIVICLTCKTEELI